MKKIYFDMDGTIANLYGVDDWLTYLQNEKVYPYSNAKCLYKTKELKKSLRRLIDNGYELNILSWLSKNGTTKYNNKVIKSKLNWLKRKGLDDLFTNKIIIPYGQSKQEIVKDDYLIDDEEKNIIGLKNGILTRGDDLINILATL